MSAATQKSRFGLIVIGDEILSGRRQDKHFPKVVELLGARGLQLSWVEILSDDRAALTAAYQRSFASGDIVLSCGGIGATPDDHTRQAAAAALGVPLELNDFAREQITIRCAENAAKGQGSADMNAPENQQRLQMGFFPQGCEAVPNPFNRIPGFFIVNEETFEFNQNSIDDTELLKMIDELTKIKNKYSSTLNKHCMDYRLLDL